MKKIPTQDEVMASWQGDLDKPVVSICCITYNHEDYIEEALSGFLTQKTDFPFEIVIHDDASTDRTADIVRDYEEKYPKLFKVIYQTSNQYSKGNRPATIVFRRCVGKYIAFCEGDDYWCDPSKLSKQVNFLEMNKDYSLTYHDAFVFSEKGVVSKLQLPGKYRRDSSSLTLKRTRPISTLTACFRNIDSFRSFPLELMAAPVGDLTLWSLLGEVGKGKFMDDILPSAYRVHDGGIFSKKDKETKSVMMIKTYAALADYYKVKDRELYGYFIEQVFKISADSSASILRFFALCGVCFTKKIIGLFMLRYR